MKVTIYRGRDGWRWRLVARNGRIVADSGEAYTRKRECRQAWARVMWAAPSATVTQRV